MKSLLPLLILFVISISSCKKETSTDPLNEAEKQQLELMIGNGNKANTVSLFYSDLFDLSKLSVSVSNPEQIKALPLYSKVYNTIAQSEANIAVLFDFILYDQRSQGEVAALSGLVLWDIADKNYSSVTQKLRNEQKFNNIDLIKYILQLR